MSMRQGEAALDRLLEQVDDAIDEGAASDGMDLYWDAWTALPVYLRDWLLWTVPAWWALPPGVFRRLLLTTARLIVWNGAAPRTALRRAAARLRLPPPRPARRRRAARLRNRRPAPRRAQGASLRRTPIIARRWGRAMSRRAASLARRSVRRPVRSFGGRARARMR
jgi:hypothetical protein